MRRTLAATAAAVTLLGGLAACSSSTSSDSKPKPTAASTSKEQAGYLYDVDQHSHSRADVEGLVQHLQSRCTDSALVVEFTATNTALHLVDATHDEDVYPVLSQFVTSLAKSSGKVNRASRLPAVEKTIKAQRAPKPSPTSAHRAAVAQPAAPCTTAPAVDDHGGATAQCNDGTLSYSQHHQSTCSHHHGVAIWYK